MRHQTFRGEVWDAKSVYGRGPDAAPGFPGGSLGCKASLWPGAGCGSRLSGGKPGVQSPSMARGRIRHQAFLGEAWGAKSCLASSLAVRHQPPCGCLVAARDLRSTDKYSWP
eukprot:2734702-Rhodomonas_salina.1